MRPETQEAPQGGYQMFTVNRRTLCAIALAAGVMALPAAA